VTVQQLVQGFVVGLDFVQVLNGVQRYILVHLQSVPLHYVLPPKVAYGTRWCRGGILSIT
jgi:hypothetical protein